MAQQQLNGAHVRPGFEQVGSKTVPKRMRCDGFKNPTTSMRFLAGYLHGVDFYVAVDCITRKQPPIGPSYPPPVAQGLQKLWREHDIAIFLALCCLPIYVALDS